MYGLYLLKLDSHSNQLLAVKREKKWKQSYFSVELLLVEMKWNYILISNATKYSE